MNQQLPEKSLVAQSPTEAQNRVVKHGGEFSSEATILQPDIEPAANETTVAEELENAETLAQGDLQELQTLVHDEFEQLETLVQSESKTREAGKSTAIASDTMPNVRRGSGIEVPQVLGDYELLGELGQGGMGVVYRAKQRRANRMVALKVIRPDKLSGMSQSSRKKIVERFRKEAQAAARLQHDNLVTVFEVGEIEGCHYFSMQYVEGGSLADKLRAGPIDNQQAAAFIEPVCRAVHAAHQVGVLHRDIKPQNILIENSTNRPRIADFGLAKLADDDMEMTRAGEALGTPPFMPPEQFGDAANCTPRSDVYALGATLYHALSGRPPFQASSSAATMRQVLDQEPVPLRQLNAAVDVELEILCMKCLEKEPARRFQTAEELANELARYLRGEPILSRPIRQTERLWRWCRRNPLIASLTGAVLISVFVAVGALAVAYVKTDQAKQVVEQSLGETQVARAMSEASFQDALSAVNEFFTRVSEDRLLNEPGAQGLRRELLSLAHTYYLRLLKQRTGDATVQEELAATHYRIGLIVEELESPAAALPSYEKARDMLMAQLQQHPDSKPRQQFLSNTLNAMGRVQARLGKVDLAEKLLRDARRMRAALVALTANAQERFEYDRLLANADMNLALLDKKRGQLDAARQLMQAAQTYRVRTLPARPLDRKLRRDLAKGHYNLANLGVDQNDAAFVRQHITQAIKLFEELLTENPDDIEDRHLLGTCRRLIADLDAALIPTDATKLDTSIDQYTQSRMAYEKLVARNPAVPRYRAELAQLLLNLGQLEAQREHVDIAIQWMKQAEALLVALVSEVPKQAEYADSLQKTRDALAELIARQKKASDQGASSK